MAEAPWFKFYTSDFLAGIVDLDHEQRGIYITLLALIYDREGPIPHDPQWLARRCGCTTRRLNALLAELMRAGKIEDRGGMLGNRRAIAEIGKRLDKSDKARKSALARWHRDEEPELDLSPPDGTDDAPERARARSGNAQSSGEKPEVNHEIISPKKERKRQNSADLADANASAPRARARVQRLDSTQPAPESDPPVRAPAREAPEPQPSRLDDTDLKALFDATCDAAGFRPVAPAQIERAYSEVQRWRDDGWDFDQDVIPTITGIMAKASPDDRTRTLGRFRQHIAHAHARRMAMAKTGTKPPAPIPDPITKVEGEEPIMESIRLEILGVVGAFWYAHHWNKLGLAREDMGEESARKPLRITGDHSVRGRALDGNGRSMILAIARKHGFTDVW